MAFAMMPWTGAKTKPRPRSSDQGAGSCEDYCSTRNDGLAIHAVSTPPLSIAAATRATTDPLKGPVHVRPASGMEWETELAKSRPAAVLIHKIEGPSCADTISATLSWPGGGGGGLHRDQASGCDPALCSPVQSAVPEGAEDEDPMRRLQG